MHSLKLGGLSISTNVLKYPRLALGTSQKAAPTVSLSNTHVERDDHSFIPFPSVPIQCPGASNFRQDMEMSCSDVLDELPSSPPPEDWHLDLHRRHARSCLATSFVHRDGHALPAPSGYESDDGQNKTRTGVPLRKRKLAHKRVKVPSVTTCLPPRKKSKKTCKRQAADLQFTATLHRSLVTHLRAITSYTLTSREVSAPDDEPTLRTQDIMLVERLWKGLLDHGFQPAPLPSPPLLSASLAVESPFILSPARVDHVFQSEPQVEGVPGLPTPPPSPYRPSVPIPIPSKASSALVERGANTPPPRGGNALPTPPTTPPQAGAPVLAMPQLVASLILRHRERSAARPRSSSACSAGVRAERGRSPLSTFVLASVPPCASA
ncbi:hypothetical protein PHLGIDRAFT_189632 [Phlebiopsis gigantea 11061_1 CR5-6]|uniref:Uncharacterized protein n=1 Tax=Phlebiopsis gigantea (strain 11061_1 CR5-6) TaxID=745531 RepID=A0A0C3S3S4_PHLG1|nr:hypothetical protein PHLGIDRAFT_189632 [Phlebiopsis gigantea 11061_1 CR5-6]